MRTQFPPQGVGPDQGTWFYTDPGSVFFAGPPGNVARHAEELCGHHLNSPSLQRYEVGTTSPPILG